MPSHVSLINHDTVLMLHDKARFHESAVAHGWPVPNGVVVREPSDVAKIASLRLVPFHRDYDSLTG
jgi:D-aspartate ligase